jgi:hypothetical protein
MQKRAPKTENSNSGKTVPFIFEFERQALIILRDGVSIEEKLKELLEEYAARYAAQSTIGA